ncbi:MAG: hypothetical protein EOR69_31970 [Mesorhizobium sp.]|nr:MAG: hypothetical protein EOR69_31970 [Mesorhizobium sp.]RWL92271.1 MAG: hypothetical protein EOR70_32135 [Mesorhizobium sp.]
MAGGKRDLSRLGAIWNAFRARDIEHFPRLTACGGVVTLKSEDVLKEIAAATKNLIDARAENATDGGEGSRVAPPSEIMKAALERGRESLDEVKGLTEYQDQKATRLLIITTFLSALSGALFGRFNQVYPLPDLLNISDWRTLLVVASYLAFSLFLLSAVGGALVIFHATRTRFKFPEPDPSNPERELAAPKSHLFFPAIISVRPSAWAESFLGQAPSSDSLQPRHDLSMRYLRNYIGESYLVAAKVADKVRYLEPAQDILAFALRSLLVWLILIGLVNVLVAPTPHPDPSAPLVDKAPSTAHGKDDIEEQPTLPSKAPNDGGSADPVIENEETR